MRGKKSRKWKILRKILFLGLILSLFFAGLVLLWLATLKIPDLESFDQRKVSESTKIYDRTGEILLYDVHENVKRKIVPFEEISRNIKNATVAIEDDQFWQHKGVKPLSFLRAVWINLKEGGFSQGGSTITQQVVKNSLLTKEKTIARKLKEWVLSVKLEKVLSKEEILAFYLNEVPYGGSIYGIEEASKQFFDKTAADLTIAESAYLAVLPNAPTFFSPYGNNRDRLEERKNLILFRMLQNGFISQEDYEKAKEEKVEFQPQPDFGIKAPHFVIYVKQYLEEKYGRDAVESGGLKVITTLDYALQEKGEEMVKEFTLNNQKEFDAENAALVAIDPKTGQILTMIGSRDYFDEEIDGNFNVSLARRQPGSAFKPFAYATAINKGYTAETVVFDLQTQFSTACAPNFFEITDVCYSPQNYDSIFRGPVSFRNALAQSINIPAIKVLYLAGLQDTLETARDMGITTLGNAGLYGLTLVLGGGEVRLLDIVGAYSVFANDGVREAHTPILRVEDKTGAVLESYKKEDRRVLPSETARWISDILSDNVARTPLFGANSLLRFDGRDVAVKTGTTNDYRDAWIIGYSPNIAVGAWAGNNDNRPMKQVAGLKVSPLWRQFIDEALKKLPVENFPDPEPIKEEGLKPVLKGVWRGSTPYYVDAFSGLRATEHTPPEFRVEKVITQVHTILYWVDKDNPRGDFPNNPNSDSQFERWEYPVRLWVGAQNIMEETSDVIPKEEDTAHGPGSTPTISILSPVPGNRYPKESRIVVSISANGKFPIAKTEFYVNGVYIGSSSRAPFSFSFVPAELPQSESQNALRVIVSDIAGNKGEAGMHFSLEE
ncbi:MAG: penicillin-binding protein [bacterium]|nr:penicillin-binding protein [bacterium]